MANWTRLPESVVVRHMPVLEIKSWQFFTGLPFNSLCHHLELDPEEILKLVHDVLSHGPRMADRKRATEDGVFTSYHSRNVTIGELKLEFSTMSEPRSVWKDLKSFLRDAWRSWRETSALEGRLGWVKPTDLSRGIINTLFRK